MRAADAAPGVGSFCQIVCAVKWGQAVSSYVKFGKALVASPAPVETFGQSGEFWGTVGKTSQLHRLPKSVAATHHSRAATEVPPQRVRLPSRRRCASETRKAQHRARPPHWPAQPRSPRTEFHSPRVARSAIQKRSARQDDE